MHHIEQPRKKLQKQIFTTLLSDLSIGLFYSLNMPQNPLFDVQTCIYKNISSSPSVSIRLVWKGGEWNIFRWKKTAVDQLFECKFLKKLTESEGCNSHADFIEIYRIFGMSTVTSKSCLGAGFVMPKSKSSCETVSNFQFYFRKMSPHPHSIQSFTVLYCT